MMPGNEPIQRVRIYLSERDAAEGQPLYLAALERLRREGATGATALRGIAGFGAGHRLRTSAIGDLSEAPIVIEWVDRPERIARVLPALDDLLPDALITVEDLRVYRALLRSGGPFGERTVGEVMARDVVTARGETPLRAAAELMLGRGQALLPALDERGGVAGVLSDGDLQRRGGLPLPAHLFPALTPDERRAMLDLLPPRTLAETMTGDSRTIYVEASIAQAISPLVEWGLELLPVIDREGRLAGLFGVEQALRAARRAPGADERVRDAEPPTLVGLVMQRAVPTIAADAPLATVMEQLLAAPARFAVALDAARPVGILSDLSLARRLAEPLRSAWLAALRVPGAPLPGLPEAAPPLTASGLADTDAPTIAERATQDEAIQIMLEGGHERLVVIDDDGRLAGLLGRRALLRALAQASAG